MTKLYEHTTQRFRSIENLTDEALQVHLARVSTEDFAKLEDSVYGEVYTKRRIAIEAEVARRNA